MSPFNLEQDCDTADGQRPSSSVQVVTLVLIVLQAAPGGEKANGAAAVAVQAVQEEATPSHDVYGHLPTPQENDKASSDQALGSGCCVPYNIGSMAVPASFCQQRCSQ